MDGDEINIGPLAEIHPLLPGEDLFAPVKIIAEWRGNFGGAAVNEDDESRDRNRRDHAAQHASGGFVLQRQTKPPIHEPTTEGGGDRQRERQSDRIRISKTMQRIDERRRDEIEEQEQQWELDRLQDDNNPLLEHAGGRGLDPRDEQRDAGSAGENFRENFHVLPQQRRCFGNQPGDCDRKGYAGEGREEEGKKNSTADDQNLLGAETLAVSSHREKAQDSNQRKGGETSDGRHSFKRNAARDRQSPRGRDQRDQEQFFSRLAQLGIRIIAAHPLAKCGDRKGKQDDERDRQLHSVKVAGFIDIEPGDVAGYCIGIYLDNVDARHSATIKTKVKRRAIRIGPMPE